MGGTGATLLPPGGSRRLVALGLNLLWTPQVSALSALVSLSWFLALLVALAAHELDAQPKLRCTVLLEKHVAEAQRSPQPAPEGTRVRAL